MNVHEVILFIIGPNSQTLCTAAVFFGLGSVFKIKKEGLNRLSIDQVIKNGMSYLAYLIIANRLDAMGVNNLFGFQGSSQLLVAVWIAIRELRVIMGDIRAIGGVEPPPIMSDRMDQMERGQVNPNSGYVDPQGLDEEILSLKNNLEKLKEVARLKSQIYEINNQIQGINNSSSQATVNDPNNTPTI